MIPADFALRIENMKNALESNSCFCLCIQNPLYRRENVLGGFQNQSFAIRAQTPNTPHAFFGFVHCKSNRSNKCNFQLITLLISHSDYKSIGECCLRCIILIKIIAHCNANVLISSHRIASHRFLRTSDGFLNCNIFDVATAQINKV